MPRGSCKSPLCVPDRVRQSVLAGLAAAMLAATVMIGGANSLAIAADNKSGDLNVEQRYDRFVPAIKPGESTILPKDKKELKSKKQLKDDKRY